MLETQPASWLLDALQQAVYDGNVEQTTLLAEGAIREGVDLVLALDLGLTRGIQVVGEAFGVGDLYLPELIIAADAMKAGTEVLVKELRAKGIERKPLGTIVIGTAAGDIHDIGKTIVASLLAASGFEVHDLGVDVSADRFVTAVQQFKADIVGISSLLTTTMANQQMVLDALAEADLRPRVKVIVGGAPVTAQWALQIGADAYGVNATEAVVKVKALLGVHA